MDTLQISQLERRRMRLAGELDVCSVRQLEEALASFDRSGEVTLDLSELSFIDSSGLHAIATFAGDTNGNQRVILEGMTAPMLRLFEITSLTQHPNLEIRVASDGQ